MHHAGYLCLIPPNDGKVLLYTIGRFRFSRGPGFLLLS